MKVRPVVDNLMFDEAHCRLSGLNTMLNGFPTKEATALCTFGYCAGPDAEPLLFEGATEGRIVDARGPSNFGWVGALVLDYLKE